MGSCACLPAVCWWQHLTTTIVLRYPVLWDLFGALDPKTVLRAATKEDIVKYRSIYRGEMALRHMREESKKSGKNLWQV